MKQFVALVCVLFVAACAPSRLPPEAASDAQSRVLESMRVFQDQSALQAQPVAILIHGASDRAWHQEYERWVNRFTAAGYAVVALDLYAGRGISGSAARSGGFVPREAAGDLMIALDWVQDQDWADKGRIFAVGSSFGGGVILDAMVFADPGRPVPAISAPPESRLDGLRAGVLLAPLCLEDILGVRISQAVYEPLYTQAPLMAVLPGADSVSDVEACRALLARESGRGTPITLAEYPGAGHTFMHQTDDYGDATPDYDRDAAEDAWGKVLDFLGGF